MALQLCRGNLNIDKINQQINEFGFTVINNFIEPSFLKHMIFDARNQMNQAKKAEKTTGLKYRANISGLTTSGQAFLENETTLELVSKIAGAALELNENSSCLTYYSQGDHLGLHLDEPRELCSITILVYLEANSPSPLGSNTGLVLNVYGKVQPLEFELPRMVIPTVVGSVVVGLGSQFWHGRPELQLKENVTAITGCFGELSFPEQPN